MRLRKVGGKSQEHGDLRAISLIRSHDLERACGIPVKLKLALCPFVAV